MPIVITGADGFIGKNLQLRLAELGHADVVGLKALLLKLDFMQRIARGEHVMAED
jgi:nucleoside-diphosphate-sugar epimerase